MKSILCILLLIAISFFTRTDENNPPINKIQVIGSHNSFKQALDPALFKVFQQIDSVSAGKLDYEHTGFGEQLSLGLRNLEIDVYADAKGGRYSRPKGLSWATNQQQYDVAGEMNAPGFKVLHIPDLDFRSNALTFTGALLQLRKWSEAHPGHTPVFITLEAKDDSISRAEFTQPEKFTANTFDELDKALTAGLGSKHLITPDQVRGKYNSLEAAVLQGNWPLLESARGKFIFILDAEGEKRALYTKGHPALKGRVLFANADPGTPESAIMIINDAKSAEIPELVKKGYIIRTRADKDTRQARNNDRSDFMAACASGAQIITTDYYQKSTRFKSDYIVCFAEGQYFRMNPLFK
ncbi:MAG TPA: phosphatidylinositol-specific phospholipase C1-like protein [Pedobacter sp.]|nr:phosphatidylinositol-specific phospholipase C1-like protein [Pedobacter sp.]